MSSNPAPQAPPMPRPRRRWWLGALALVALLALTAFGILCFLAYTADNAWRNAEAETDALDPRWRLAELEADRAPIADADNAALQIIAAQSKGTGVSVDSVPKYEQIFDKLSPTAQLNGQQIQAIQGALGKIPAALADARKLKDMPRGRFRVTFSDDWISTLVPHLQHTRQLGDWLQHDAYLLVQEDECDKALDSCQALLNAARTAGDDRMLIGHLVRIALQHLAVGASERVLAQGAASEERLLELQTLVAREVEESNWLGSLKSERAGHHHLFDNLRTGKVKSTFLSGSVAPNNFFEWMMDKFPSTMLKYYPEHLRSMNQLVEAAKLPLHEQKARLLEVDRDAGSRRNPLSRMLTPAYVKVLAAEQRSQGMLRTALVGLACERYRLKHENWPTSLDLLVAEKLLPALPLDPIDGQPLRYRHNDGFIVIYSIGNDEKDDQGNIDHNRMNQPGFDIGFRLWSEGQRRGEALPPAVLAEPRP